MLGFVSWLVKFRDRSCSDWKIRIHNFIFSPRVRWPTTTLSYQTLSLSSTPFLGLWKRYSFFRLRRVTFFKWQNWAKRPSSLRHCDSWASLFSRHFLVNSSFTLHTYLMPDESVQIEKSPFFHSLKFWGPLLQKKSMISQKNFFGVSPAELNYTIHFHTVSWCHLSLLVVCVVSELFLPFKLWNFRLINCIGSRKLRVFDDINLAWTEEGQSISWQVKIWCKAHHSFSALQHRIFS